MNYAEQFKTDLLTWLDKNDLHIENIWFSSDFAYRLSTNEILFGLYSYEETAQVFDEFLDEIGLEIENILNPVLAFLHEVGHSRTIHQFSDEELILYYHIKENLNLNYLADPDAFPTNMKAYWRMNDELAANQWLVDFVNNNLEAIIELQNIFISGLTNLYKNYKLDELMEVDYAQTLCS